MGIFYMFVSTTKGCNQLLISVFSLTLILNKASNDIDNVLFLL